MVGFPLTMSLAFGLSMSLPGLVRSLLNNRRPLAAEWAWMSQRVRELGVCRIAASYNGIAVRADNSDNLVWQPHLDRRARRIVGIESVELSHACT